MPMRARATLTAWATWEGPPSRAGTSAMASALPVPPNVQLFTRASDVSPDAIGPGTDRWLSMYEYAENEINTLLTWFRSRREDLIQGTLPALATTDSPAEPPGPDHVTIHDSESEGHEEALDGTPLVNTPEPVLYHNRDFEVTWRPVDDIPFVHMDSAMTWRPADATPIFNPPGPDPYHRDSEPLFHESDLILSYGTPPESVHSADAEPDEVVDFHGNTGEEPVAESPPPPPSTPAPAPAPGDDNDPNTIVVAVRANSSGVLSNGSRIPLCRLLSTYCPNNSDPEGSPSSPTVGVATQSSSSGSEESLSSSTTVCPSTQSSHSSTQASRPKRSRDDAAETPTGGSSDKRHCPGPSSPAPLRRSPRLRASSDASSSAPTSSWEAATPSRPLPTSPTSSWEAPAPSPTPSPSPIFAPTSPLFEPQSPSTPAQSSVAAPARTITLTPEQVVLMKDNLVQSIAALEKTLASTQRTLKYAWDRVKDLEDEVTTGETSLSALRSTMARLESGST